MNSRRSKRPSYQWEKHLRKDVAKVEVPLRRAGTMEETKQQPRLRSCLKKSHPSASQYSQHSLDADKAAPGHIGRVPRTTRRPSKTRSLDEDSDMCFDMKSTRAASLTRASSSTSLGGQVVDRAARQQRRRRTTDTFKQTPAKGILRTSSLGRMPDMGQAQKKVSFSDLDRCRWNSQGSGLNVKSRVTKAGSTDPQGGSSGNFVWEKVESSARKVLRTESLSGISLLLKQEVKRQAPSKPSRRSSNDSDTSVSSSGHAGKSMESSRSSGKAPNMPRRRNSKDFDGSTTASATIFHQTSVSDFQASVNSTMLIRSKSTGSSLNAPCMPRRSNSREYHDNSSQKVLRSSVANFEASVRNSMVPKPVKASKGQGAPCMPSRSNSMEHNGAASAPTNDVFQTQTNALASVRTSILVKRPPTPGSNAQPQATLSRRNSREHSPASVPAPKNVFQAKVNDFQTSLIGSLCAKSANASFELADPQFLAA